nr:Uncharacterised protein [Klebsiella pneumoniae]
MGDTAEQMAKSWGSPASNRMPGASFAPAGSESREEGKLSAEVMTAYAPLSANRSSRTTIFVKIQRSQIIRSYARPLTANMAPSPPPTVRR